jgi:CheY-like chemotaxis protein
VFEPFIQGERSTDRAQGGLGLGLALARSLVELHGGSVEASSPGVGRGSEFVVRLPRLEDAPGAAPATPDQTPAPGAGRRRVLVVEDNAAAAETLCDLLELWGHEVRAVNTGMEALRLAVEFEPDAALVDIGLPGMDGCAVAEGLRRDRRTAAIRLIAVTGYGQTEDRRRSLEAGFDEHLTKPVDPEELRALLEADRAHATADESLAGAGAGAAGSLSGVE